MNILVTLNEAYVEPLWVMLSSLFEHEKEFLNIYLMYFSVSQDSLKNLTNFIEKNGRGKLTCVPVAGMILPETLERILYLDSDILIHGSFASFYHMEFGGNILIGITDATPPGWKLFERSQKHKERLGLSPEDVYVNSGVLLIDLMEMRKQFVLKDFCQQVEKIRDDLEWPDQDAINVYFRGKIGVVDEVYNYPTWFDIPGYWKWYTGEVWKAAPRIIHYRGISKPWHIDYMGKYYFEYRRYARKLQNRRERLLFELKHVLAYIQVLAKLFVLHGREK